MKAFIRLLFLLSILPGCFKTTEAQSLEQRLNRTKPSCSEIFANAMEIIPELKMSGAYDSIRYVIDIIDKSCEQATESFDLKVLLAIQLDQFGVEGFYDAVSISTLDSRASSYDMFVRYPHTVKAQAEYYRFTSSWASELIIQKNLDKNELLICKVIAGVEKSPSYVIMKNQLDYPYLYELLQEAKTAERKKPMGFVSLMGGYWIPTNNLKILGSHPSFGFQIGQHTQSHEFALTLQFRFSQAESPYKVVRNDSLYELTHFFGGYIGLDYTRYLLRNDDVEFGLLVGAGYDGFDISKSDYEDYLKPVSIGCFNVNTGLRFNYFYTTKGFIGLQARYNIVNYKNTGGSSLKGDCFSIDLILGFGHN
jgi:hypothetical protein